MRTAWALAAFFFASLFFTTSVFADNTLIPVITRRDMVFDHAGKYLYITTSDGWIRRYNLVSGQLENGYNLGGSLNGADIASDDSYLLVAQSDRGDGHGVFQRVDLISGAVVNIDYSSIAYTYGAAAWDVAIASNGRAFATVLQQFSPLLQIDLATNTVTQRDVPAAPGAQPLIFSETQIHRSADGNRLYFLEGDASSGPVFSYDARSDSFGRYAQTNGYFSYATGAVNRDGSIVSTLLGMTVYSTLQIPKAAIDTVPDLHFVRGIKSVDRGMAFDPQSDTFYGVNSSTQEIVAYDTITFAERFRLPIPDSIATSINAPIQFGTGILVASPNGRYLALATVPGVRLFSLRDPSPVPTPSPTTTLAHRRDMVFDHTGKFLYVGTSDGLLERYDLRTRDIQVVADMGGSLNGIDISPDDSFIFAAQDFAGVAEAAFQRVDLISGQISNVTFPLLESERRAWDVAIGSNGRALGTTDLQPGWSGFTLLREINLTNNTTAIRGDIPGPDNTHPGMPYKEIVQATQIHRSADHTRMYLLGGNSSGGPIFTYSALSNSFGPYVYTNTFLDWASAAVSRDGSLLATRHGYPNLASVDRADNLDLLHVFNFDAGVAFDPTSDTLYAIDTKARQVIAYNSITFAELFRIDIGADTVRPQYQFDTGILLAGTDGQHLALTTPTGVRLIDLPVSPTENPARQPLFGGVRDFVFDHRGHYLYISTALGYIWPFDLTTGQLGAPYNLGGSLNAIDVALDDSTLLVAQGNVGIAQGMFQKILLTNGAISNITYSRGFSEGGGWDVGIGVNGIALATTVGSSVVRQISLQNNVITSRPDAPSLSKGEIQVSSDRTRLLLRSLDYSSAPATIFDVAGNTFGPSVSTSNVFGTYAAINRNGSFAAVHKTHIVTLYNLPSFNPAHDFSNLDGTVAFDGARDILYGINASTDEIVGYDTNTFAEKTRFAVGEDLSSAFAIQPFDTGTIVTSPDGHYLAFLSPNGLRIFDLNTKKARVLSTASYLGNISTRALVHTGDEVAIAGFIITGTQEKRIVVRAIGPSLSAAGVPGVLNDPTLELYDSSGSSIAANDDWRVNEADLKPYGMAPGDDRESALVRRLSPGAYTAILRGKNGATGVGLIELYDLDGNATANFGNISTRSFVGNNDNVTIAGVIISARPDFDYKIPGSVKVVIRGIGPSLASAGVTNALQNPRLDLYNSNGFLVASNDNWQSGYSSSQIQALGLAPKDNREAAILNELGAGAYTVILKNADGATGVGLIEVYNIQ
jgi:WD40 repeat protein